MNEKNSNVVGRFVGKGVFPHQWAFTLLIPLRNFFLSPRRLIDRLELKEDFHVLEVGPGPGYFSVKVAETLIRGALVLADVQQEMLDRARKRLDKRGLTNVTYCRCDGQTFPFPGETFDRIFLVTVLGEVENKAAYAKEFHRLLKPGGLLSVSEQAGDPDRMTGDEIRQWAENAGFVFYRQYGNERNYTSNFKK